MLGIIADKDVQGVHMWSSRLKKKKIASVSIQSTYIYIYKNFVWSLIVSLTLDTN